MAKENEEVMFHGYAGDMYNVKESQRKRGLSYLSQTDWFPHFKLCGKYFYATTVNKVSL